MASGIPPSGSFTGLTQRVIEYGEKFEALVAKAKQGLAEEDWQEIEALVDVPNYERVGVFLTDAVETIDWPTYKGIITQFGGHTDWDGKLRRITEGDGVVIQELQEYNTREGVTSIANTVTIFTFSDAGLIDHLDVYVAPLGERPA